MFIAAGMLLAVCSCTEKPQSKPNHPLLEEMNWLIGTWKNVSADGVSYEIWNSFHDSAYLGVGFMLIKGDTLFSEIISLESRNGELYYIPLSESKTMVCRCCLNLHHTRAVNIFLKIKATIFHKELFT
ncbi:MAG TPA: DUF6265 family protein [Bacteroidia bacterium]|nr:DUF6265 family protein [Bacteroidia bacterium]